MTIYNEKRKQLLMMMDEGKSVSNLDLGMYDLTPYYVESDNQTLVEKILYVKNDLRQVKHIKDKKVCFAPQQLEALDFLREKDRCILSAPTSFGKTLIIKEYIYVEKPTIVVYIVPTNALAYELENSFKNNPSFFTYSIFDRKKLEITEIMNDEPLLFIGTQEKYLEIKDSLPEKIDLFVIDEAYKLEDSTREQRGYKLSESFLDSVTRKSKKIFLLSPNAKFIGFEKYDFKDFNSLYNPVDKVFSIIDEEKFFHILYKKAQKDKTILFCDTPSLINETIGEICSYFGDIKYNDFISFLETEYHPDWSVVRFLKKGILVHHGQMPKYIQNKMINLFNKNNDYSLLVGTNSISEGINTPTKNMFIHPKCSSILTNKFLLKNTIGRAGRLGEYPIGHIYSISNISDVAKENIEIRLSISQDENLEEIENSVDEEKIEEMCSDFEIEKEFYYKIRKNTHYSIGIILKILQVLKKDLHYKNISNLPFMAESVFKEYSYFTAKIDSICIRGVLQYSYKNNYNQYVSLNTYKDKIEFYRKCSRDNVSNSIIIDYYMRFIYSSLDHYIYPIAKIGMDLYDAYPKWPFGEFVVDTLKKFIERYNKLLLGLSNMDQYSEEQKIILQSLKDYGILINNDTINLEMITEIEERLNVRYSTYDIINSIKFLADNSKNNRLKFTYLKNRYID